MSNVDCAAARRELLRGVDRVSGRVSRHLGDCAGCAAFTERFAAARTGFRRHHAGAVPDAGFAARVTAALPGEKDSGGADAVTWMALRLLPAAVALALVLGAWSWMATSRPSDLAASATTDDVLAWVLENGA